MVVTDEFKGWYEALTEGEQEAIVRAVTLLEQEGVALRHPHSSAINGASFALGNVGYSTRADPTECSMRCEERNEMARRVTKWNDLAHKVSPGRRAQIAREVADEILERNLSELRAISGKTQAEVAAALRVTQGQVSQTESREDHKLSTLRRYVEALGGELEVVAAFGDRRVRLLGV